MDFVLFWPKNLQTFFQACVGDACFGFLVSKDLEELKKRHNYVYNRRKRLKKVAPAAPNKKINIFRQQSGRVKRLGNAVTIRSRYWIFFCGFRRFATWIDPTFDHNLAQESRLEHARRTTFFSGFFWVQSTVSVHGKGTPLYSFTMLTETILWFKTKQDSKTWAEGEAQDG